jgi:predicted DNA-binding transcriptional regulator AlpA
MESEAGERFVSKREIAALLGISERQVERLRALGLFPAPLDLPGRAVRWSLQAVHQWLRERGLRGGGRGTEEVACA